jgi:hypothetical protein
MKGVVFTELLEFVEDSFGFDVADAVLEEAGVKGTYTQVGNYPFDELVALVVGLSKVKDIPVPDLLEVFGRHLFKRLIAIYPQALAGVNSSIDLFGNVHSNIHVEVKKLYPDTELPSFEVVEKTDNSIKMIYGSEKRLEDFARGLMLGCADHFNETIMIDVKELSNDPHKAEFTVTKQ